MRAVFIVVSLLFGLILIGTAPAFAESPLAVLKSDKDAETYSEQHLGTFDDDWTSFKRTLEAANVRYDLLNDSDIKAGISKISQYRMIVIPFLVDVPSETVPVLQDYVRGGGKLLITDGGGTPTASAQALLNLTGVQVTKHTSMTEQEQLVWARQPQPLNEAFAVGTLIADVQPTNPGADTAKWIDASGQAVGIALSRSNGSTFLTWAVGLQGEISTNAQIITLAMEDAVPGITQQAAVQISFADYQNIQGELDYLKKRTDEAINTAKQADLAVSFKTIQQHYESALAHVKSFDDAYQQRHFYEADDELAAARNDFAMAFAQAMPVRPVESRAVWLDRGTIVAAKDPAGLSKVFDKLKLAGFNAVYFETNNAGWVMFPSQVAKQNPQTIGWDPLSTAVEEAHKRGMEIHAWMWSFNVGNTLHNPIIGKESDYPGPVLSSHDFSWALESSSGSLLAHNQHEFWIDPSNPKGRQYIKDLACEIASKYAVDGLQFDYIRYPFNGKGTEMGYDWAGRSKFERETGLNLDKMDDETRTVWQAWKIEQVSSFVHEASDALRKVHPGIRISAAVYALPRNWRLSAIEQEWETWVKNGWVDTLNPMTYVATAKELANNAGYVRESTCDNALVFPGLSIRQLDTAGLIEQMDTARYIGTLGNTMFAAAQLDDKKVNILRQGPYRRMPYQTPQSDPLKACRVLVDDFAGLVNRYLQDPQKHIISDQASTNEVLQEIEALQRRMHELHQGATAEEIADVNKSVSALQDNVKNWLRIEAFVQRGYRAQYITSYLSQVQAILSYAAHKAQCHTQSVAATSVSH